MIWVLLVLLYGLLKGAREIAKKKAMEKNTVMEVLVVYTIISFIMVIPQAPFAGGVQLKTFLLIAFKSFCIFIAWICSFHSLKKLPVSLYGVLDLSRVLFATLFGITILGETLKTFQFVGLVFVCLGLILLKFKRSTEKTESSSVFVFLALVSCFLNAISGLLDKILMQSITSAQLQFWYMIFLVAYYLLYILIKKEKINFSVLKNPFVYVLAIMFVIGDKALFVANGMSGSKVTIMTLIKQSGCLVTILGGRFIFNEKNICYKLFCASVIIAGIIFSII